MTLKDGLELEGHGAFGRAAKEYQRLLQQATKPKERAELLLRLGCALRCEGELDDAEEQLGEALAIARETGDERQAGLVLVEQGQVAEERGALKVSAQHYETAERLLSTTPDGPVVALKLASVERRRGELSRALVRLQDVNANPLLTPEIRSELLDELGAVHVARGSYEQAVEVLRRAVDADLAASREFEAGRSRLLLAEAYLGLGERSKAKQLIGDALNTYDHEHNKRGMSEAYLVQGRLHEDAQDFDQAARCYRKGLKLDQESEDRVGQARALRHLAAVRRQQGDFEEAADQLDEARTVLRGLDEDDVERGVIYIEQGLLAMVQLDYDKAASNFRSALRLAEEDEDSRAIAVAQRHLATVRAEEGELAEAVASLEQALALIEGLEDRRELGEVLDDLAEVLIAQGHYRRAIDYLDRALELDDRVGATGSRARTVLLLGRATLPLGERKRAGRYLAEALEEFEAVDDDRGVAAAAFERGTWLANEGKDKDAIKLFRQSLLIVQKQGNRVAIVRACRELGAAYRRMGDFERAEEYLDDAAHELGQAQDATERGLLGVETARLALSRGALDAAWQQLRTAKRELEESGSIVEAALCLRLMAEVERARGKYTRALELLHQARAVFEEHEEKPELDDVYDELAETFRLIGDLPAARTAVHRSLELGHEMGWYRGNGRSYVLLGDIESDDGNHRAAQVAYTDAQRAYEEAENESGLAVCHERLGDWHYQHGDAVTSLENYKDARRKVQVNRDTRGFARLSRKLGEVYLSRNALGRAEEALEQAEDHLRGDTDGTEQGEIHLVMGHLFKARNDHNNAVSTFEKALRAFHRSGNEERLTTTKRSMVESYKMLGQADKALELLRDLGEANASMWRSLLSELDPVVTRSAQKAFYAGDYSNAVTAAFAAVEQRVRDLTGNTDEGINDVFSVSPGAQGRVAGGRRSKQADLRFREFAVASFELFSHPVMSGDQLPAPLAFGQLCVASLIVSMLPAEAGVSTNP